MFKRLESLSNRAVITVLMILALVSFAVSLLVNLLRPLQDPAEWFEGLLLNFGSEMLGAIITFVLLYLVVEAREKRVEKQETTREEKTRLVRHMGSRDNALVLIAVKELSANGWLSDQTLVESDLHGANLEGAPLYSANLLGASLNEANLKDAKLQEATLRSAWLEGADLQGADLERANLQNAHGLVDEQLSRAYRLRGAKMQDGSRYDGRFNLPGDLGAAQESGVDFNNPEAMAKFYDWDWYTGKPFKEVAPGNYLNGQDWARDNLPRLRGEVT